jgi:hypothetical protein
VDALLDPAFGLLGYPKQLDAVAEFARRLDVCL